MTKQHPKKMSLQDRMAKYLIGINKANEEAWATLNKFKEAQKKGDTLDISIDELLDATCCAWFYFRWAESVMTPVNKESMNNLGLTMAELEKITNPRTV